MKRLTAIMLGAALLLGLLSGCAGDGLESGDPAGREDVQNPTGSEEEPPSPEPAGGESEEGDPPEEEPPEEEPFEEEPFVWEVDDPENHGMDGERLERLHGALDSSTIYSMVTVKDGVIVDEYYAEEYDETSVFRLASCSKSFTGSLIGIAIDEGLIESVDVSIAAYFPQLAGTEKEDITVRHLLEHTSGIEWYEWSGGTTFRDLVSADNWVEFVLGRQMAAEPGTTFNYTTGGSHLLGAVFQQAAGMTLSDYGQERLFGPMGMDSVVWRVDDQGVTDGGNGISMTARDAAKFGLLYLQGGRWGERQLVPAEWVEQSTQVQVARYDRTGSYGYQWWIQSFGDGNYDTFYAMGAGGQYIFVVPELELVCVITGMSSDTYAPWPYFTDYVLAACG